MGLSFFCRPGFFLTFSGWQRRPFLTCSRDKLRITGNKPVKSNPPGLQHVSQSPWQADDTRTHDLEIHCPLQGIEIIADRPSAIPSASASRSIPVCFYQQFKDPFYHRGVRIPENLTLSTGSYDSSIWMTSTQQSSAALRVQSSNSSGGTPSAMFPFNRYFSTI